MRLVFVLLLLGVTVVQTSQQQYKVISDVQYCTGGGKPLLMDIFIPISRWKTPTPAVLWLHGGGWERGREEWEFRRAHACRCWVCHRSIFYRLSGDSPFPATFKTANVRFGICGLMLRRTVSIQIVSGLQEHLLAVISRNWSRRRIKKQVWKATVVGERLKPGSGSVCLLRGL